MLLRRLLRLDDHVMLLLNDWGGDTIDWIFLLITNRFTWIPLYILFIVLLFRYYKLKEAFIGLGLFGLAVAFADLISVHLFKNVFERLRPCHDAGLEGLSLLAESCGGQFGFVSSHAANSYAIAVVFYFLFNKHFSSYWVFWWAGLVAYSRVYIGVHYPADVLAGAILGAAIGFAITRLYKRFKPA